MKIMGTGCVLVSDGYKVVHCKWKDGNELHIKQFTYTKLIHWHFQYHRIADDHNNSGHALSNIEDP